MVATAMTLTSLPSHVALASTTLLIRTRAPYCSFNTSVLLRRTPILISCATKQHMTSPAQAREDAPNVSEVFTDDSTGVVCYQNEHGETVCEGLDEGPHFDPQLKDGTSSGYVPENLDSETLPTIEQPMYEI